MNIDHTDYDKDLNLLVSLVGAKGADHLINTKESLIKSKDAPAIENPFAAEESAWEVLKRKHQRREYVARPLGGEATKLTPELHHLREQLKVHDQERKDEWGSGHRRGETSASSKLERQTRKQRAEAAPPISHTTDTDCNLNTQIGVGSKLAEIFKDAIAIDEKTTKYNSSKRKQRPRPRPCLGHLSVSIAAESKPQSERKKEEGNPSYPIMEVAPKAKLRHVGSLGTALLSSSAVRSIQLPPPKKEVKFEKRQSRKTSSTTTASMPSKSTPNSESSAQSSVSASSMNSSIPVSSQQAVDPISTQNLTKALMAARNKGRTKKPGVFDHLKKKKVVKKKEVVEKPLHHPESGIRLLQIVNIYNATWSLPEPLIDRTRFQRVMQTKNAHFKRFRPGPLQIAHTAAAFYRLPLFLEEQFEKEAQTTALDSDMTSTHTWSLRDQKSLYRQVERNHRKWAEGIVDEVEHELLPETYRSFADYSHARARAANRLTSKKAIRKAGLMDKFTARRIRIPQAVPELQNIICCAFGEKHCVALDVNGKVWTWGVSTVGRLGRPSNSIVDPIPRPVMMPHIPEGSRVVHVSAGADFSALVLNTGELYTWGCGDDGKLGHNGFMHMFRPQLVLNLLRQNQKIIQVSCGRSHMLVLSSSGLVFSSGESSHGRLGNGPGKAGIRNRVGFESSADVNDVAELEVVASLLSHKTIHISAGRSHSMAVGDNYLLYTCGKGINGCLGHGSDQDVWKFKVVTELLKEKIVKAAGGGMHSAAITESGDLYTWGTTMYGRLGEGSPSGDTVWSPRLVTSLKGRFVADVICGRSHTVVLVNETGEAPGGGHILYCFGDDEAGQLGIHDWDGGRQLPSYCNGRVLAWSEIPPQRRFIASIPSRVIRLADRRIEFVAAGSSSSVTGTIASERRPLPSMAHWFENVCDIPPGNATRYAKRFESAGFPNVESIIFASDGVIKHILGWQNGEEFASTVGNKDSEKVIAQRYRQRRPLDMAGKGYPVSEPGFLLVCGRANYWENDDQSQALEQVQSAATLGDKGMVGKCEVIVQGELEQLETSSEEEAADEASITEEVIALIEGDVLDLTEQNKNKEPKKDFFSTNLERKRKAAEERKKKIEDDKINPRGIYGDAAVAASYEDYYYS